jgi:hypothetical protein
VPMSHVQEEIVVDRAVHMNCLDDAGSSAIRVHPEIESPSNRKMKPNLTADGRRALVEYLLTRVEGDQQEMKLKRGALSNAASIFGVTCATVSCIWKRAMESKAEGSVCIDVMARKRGRSGRKKKEIDSDLIKSIPLVNRKNVRALAAGMGLSASTIHRAIKDGRIKRHSNAIKPFLTDENQIERLRFCLKMLNPDNQNEFQDMMDQVHIDEKWFYITEQAACFLLAPCEEPPHRTAKSKQFITKVMFMCGVAAPRHDTVKNQFFDSKLGVWPFVYQEPAKRSSKNCQRGTMVTKCIESVNKEICKMLINNVLPAVRERFPRGWHGKRTNTIKIQQDNARPHVSNDDPTTEAELSKDGRVIELVSQPPNSPDMNVFDLGFFRAIQSLQHQVHQKGINDLISATINAFQDLHWQKLTNIFLTWQGCMIECMKCGGGNRYKIPHMAKAALLRHNVLLTSLSCPEEVRLGAEALLAVNE